MPEVSYADVQSAIGDNPISSGPPSSISIADSQKIGTSNPIQYTEPKPPPEPNLTERVGEDIEKPFIQTQHTMGALTSWLGANVRDNTPFGALGDRINRTGIVLQERAQRSLSKNFSNFTPNMLDDIVGAVPTIAGLIGATAAGVPAAVTTGILATGAGLGIAAEEFNKFKLQGKSTPEADALAVAIGVPVGGVMAAGFGIVSKLTTPWFKNMFGATIGKIIGEAAVNRGASTLSIGAAGGAAMGSQAVTQDVGEFLTGAEPFKGAESLEKILTDTAHNTILGTVLGGALGLHYGLTQHAKFEAGLKEAGLTNAQAKQTASDILGQGSHVLMDAVEKHLNITPDEQSRIQAPPASGEVRPNILVKSGIPNDLNFPSIDTVLSPDEVVEKTSINRYVKLEPLKLEPIWKEDPQTGKLILDEKRSTSATRLEIVGGRSQQLLRGSNLRTDMKSLMRDEELPAFWNLKYSPEMRQRLLDEPEKVFLEKAKDLHTRLSPKEKFQPDMDVISKAASKFRDQYSEYIRRSFNLRTETLQALEMHKQFIKENGEVAQSLGTIHHIIDDFVSSRLWKETPSERVIKITKGMGPDVFSAHSLTRVYKDELEGLVDGRELKTTSLPDLDAILNQDMTMVNYGRQLEAVLEKTKGTPYGRRLQIDRIPKGWTAYEGTRDAKAFLDNEGHPQISRTVFASPEGVYDGLRPLMDPDWFRSKIPGVDQIKDVQAYLKTAWLGLSGYHDTTFLFATLASKGGIKTLAEFKDALENKLMDTEAFRQDESDWVKDGLVTPNVSQVQDIRSNLDERIPEIEKFLRAPVLKQLKDFSEKHAEFLFGPYQRWIKVKTANAELAHWIGKNPNASDEQLVNARQSIAEAVNDRFGGRNWEVLGYDKTQQSMLQFFLLAPDWVTSGFGFGKSLFEVGAGANSNRWNLAWQVGMGYAVGNALNLMLSGHPMTENPKGHKFGIQIAPNVYFDPIRGMAGEVVKLLDKVVEKGGLGALQYLENKVAPAMSTFLRAVDKETWKGDNPLQRTINGAWALVSHDLPIPFNIQSGVSYATQGDQNALGWAGIASGTARYSPISENQKTHDLNKNVINAYKNNDTNFVNNLISKGDLSQEQADKLQEESQKPDAERHIEHMRIDKALKYFDTAPDDDKKEIRDLVEEKYQRYQDSDAAPNEKKKVEKLYKQFMK